jgi:alginate O-acetyltransferase complex protein AlgJ
MAPRLGSRSATSVPPIGAPAAERRVVESPVTDGEGAAAIEGRVHIVKDGRVKGWIWRPARPQERLELEVLVDDVVVARGCADRPRPDLCAAGIGDGAHGFLIDLPADLAIPSRRSIDLRTADTVERLVFSASYRVTTTSEEHPFAGSLFVPLRRARPQTDEVRALIGREDWLFLVGDTNATVEQLAGTRTLSPSDIRSHVDSVTDRAERLAAQGVAHLLAFAPMKERVYRELLPAGLVVRDDLRPAALLTQALCGVPGCEPLDLLPVLRAARSHGDVYSHTDHHWNSRGAFYAAQALLREAGGRLPGIAPLPADAARFVPDPFFGGDLAEKPKVALVNGVFTSIPDGERDWSEVVDRVDRTQLHACEVEPERHLRRSPTRAPLAFERADASWLPRCLLVGDSFCLDLLPWLAECFSRLAFVWLADPPLDLVEAERPDLLLEVKSERFLVRQQGQA